MTFRGGRSRQLWPSSGDPEEHHRRLTRRFVLAVCCPFGRVSHLRPLLPASQIYLQWCYVHGRMFREEEEEEPAVPSDAARVGESSRRGEASGDNAL